MLKLLFNEINKGGSYTRRKYRSYRIKHFIFIGGYDKLFEEVKNVVIWMEILGIPTIFGLTSWCVNQCICFKRKLDILMKAQKAQMRAQLLKDYYFY